MSSFAHWRAPLLFAAIGSAMAVGVGCNSQPEAITSQTSKYEVADGAATPGAASQGAESRPIDPEKFEYSATARPVSPTDASGIGEAGNTAVDGVAAAGETPQKPSSTPPPAVQQAAGQTSATVDRNDPQQMLAYLEELLKTAPRGSSREEAMSRYEGTQNEVIDVANALLAMKTDDPTKRRAAEGKVQALTVLTQLGRKQAEEDLRVFLVSLAKSDNAELARFGKRMGFAQRMDGLARGNVDDSAKVIQEFEGLFTDEKKDAALFMLGNQVAQLFMQQGMNKEALAAMKVTHQAFHDHADPEVAKQTKALGEEIRMVELDFNSKLRAYMQDEPNGEKDLFEAIQQQLKTPNVGETTLAVMHQIAQVLESLNLDHAARLHQMARAAFESHPDQAISERAVASAETFSKRKAIVGQPFVVEGTLMNGSPFDWSAYRGKVVLIDFWATWCGPCLKEMPNIRANYDQYHDQGFEVVGINLDERPEILQQFFSVQKFPWTTVLSPDPEKIGFEHPLAVKCGVEFIPFIVLVGRDGKALALNVRGEELGKRLAELFPANPQPGTPPANPTKAKDGGKTSALPNVRPGAKLTSFVGFGNSKAAPVEFNSHAAQSSNRVVRSIGQSIASTVDVHALALLDESQAAGAGEPAADESNPYLAAEGLSTQGLIDFIQNMQDKPQTIQKRPGFAAAIVDAATRALAGSPDDKQRQVAALAKFDALHRLAESGDAAADEQLSKFAEQLQGDPQEAIAAEVRFVQAEQTALAASELPLEKLPESLSKLHQYLEKETLAARHLRMASAIVEAINRLGDDDFREARFQEFGQLFAKSSNKEVARYGKRLAETPESTASQWIGKPVELTGTTVLGDSFDWTRFRGQVVVIDIWATWCGPCRVQMPLLKALHEKLSTRGFDVVGVSVDKDDTELAKFLEENSLPWTTLVGQDSLDFARRLGVRGIPTMLLVDQDGRVVAVSHSVADLAPKAEMLVATKSDGKPAAATP